MGEIDGARDTIGPDERAARVRFLRRPLRHDTVRPDRPNTPWENAVMIEQEGSMLEKHVLRMSKLRAYISMQIYLSG